MKTGSTSLWRAVISKYNPQHRDYRNYRRINQHISYRDKIRQGRADPHDRFVLTIRNPYSIIISLYDYVMRGYVVKGSERDKPPYDKDFSYFLENDYHRFNSTLLDYISGCPKYDIIRYETYAEDIERIFHLDINKFEHVTHGNKQPTTVDSALARMKPEHIKFINEQYRDDFVTFGYEMVNVDSSK